MSEDYDSGGDFPVGLSAPVKRKHRRHSRTKSSFTGVAVGSSSHQEEEKREAFYFRQRNGRVDMRSIGKLDVDRIIREVDIDCLQNVLENLTFGELNEDDLRFCTDQQVIKLFHIAQLTIEYMLYAQQDLISNLHTLALKYQEKKRFVQNGCCLSTSSQY